MNKSDQQKLAEKVFVWYIPTIIIQTNRPEQTALTQISLLLDKSDQSEQYLQFLPLLFKQ